MAKMASFVNRVLHGSVSRAGYVVPTLKGIDSLPLTTRTRNVLIRGWRLHRPQLWNDRLTVTELTRCSEATLLCGPKILNEIRAALAPKGLSLLS